MAEVYLTLTSVVFESRYCGRLFSIYGNNLTLTSVVFESP